MSKYLEFKEILFKAKTKKFEVVSKTSVEQCPECMGEKYWLYHNYSVLCLICDNKREIPIVLGRISWYPQWRQYIFSPCENTVWNKDCLKDIQDFLQKLMDERKVRKTKSPLLNTYDSLEGIER